jgi:hypothetical protein
MPETRGFRRAGRGRSASPVRRGKSETQLTAVAHSPTLPAQNGYSSRTAKKFRLSSTVWVGALWKALQSAPLVLDRRQEAPLWRGVTLVHLQRAIWLGCARKYVALLNGSEHAPMLVTSLNYFSALVEEVADTSVGEDYWKYTQNKVTQLERMWLDRTPARG